jgi:uncharacterized membrane protein
MSLTQGHTMMVTRMGTTGIVAINFHFVFEPSHAQYGLFLLCCFLFLCDTFSFIISFLFGFGSSSFGATIAPGGWLAFVAHVARVTGGLSTIFFGILSGGGL